MSPSGPSRRPTHEATDCVQCITRRACLVAPLGRLDLEELQPRIRKRSFRRGDTLVSEGVRAQSVHIVKLGTVLADRQGLDGRRRPICMAGRGATCGVFGVFDLPAQASAVTASAGRVCEIPVDELRMLAARDEAYARYLARRALEVCGRIAAWSEAMRVRGITNQLAYSLLLLAEADGGGVIELPTHTTLADLLGTTRETVARALATLEAEGRIRRRDRKRCEVVHEHVLARLHSEESRR